MKLIAQFGTIDAPSFYAKFDGGNVGGIGILVNIIIRSLIVIASIYTVFNLVLAGYWYLSAAGDSKRISEASSKIWQSVIGVVVAGGAVMLAGLIGKIFFGNSSAILDITIFTP